MLTFYTFYIVCRRHCLYDRFATFFLTFHLTCSFIRPFLFTQPHFYRTPTSFHPYKMFTPTLFYQIPFLPALFLSILLFYLTPFLSKFFLYPAHFSTNPFLSRPFYFKLLFCRKRAFFVSSLCDICIPMLPFIQDSCSFESNSLTFMSSLG